MIERLLIAGLIAAGFLLTAVNGVSSYRGARRRLRAASDRITGSARFAAEEAGSAGDAGGTEQSSLSAHEALNAVNDVLRSGRTGLLLAGFGLLLSTVGALWDVFV